MAAGIMPAFEDEVITHPTVHAMNRMPRDILLFYGMWFLQYQDWITTVWSFSFSLRSYSMQRRSP
jgi:hypothetical protein